MFESSKSSHFNNNKQILGILNVDITSRLFSYRFSFSLAVWML